MGKIFLPQVPRLPWINVVLKLSCIALRRGSPHKIMHMRVPRYLLHGKLLQRALEIFDLLVGHGRTWDFFLIFCQFDGILTKNYCCHFMTKNRSSKPLIKSNMAPILARLSASSAFFRPSVASIRGARMEKTSMCWPEQNLEEDGDGMEKTSRYVWIDTDQVYTLQPAGSKSSSALLTPPQDQG